VVENFGALLQNQITVRGAGLVHISLQVWSYGAGLMRKHVDEFIAVVLYNASV